MQKIRTLSLVAVVAFAAACIPPKIEIVTAPPVPANVSAPAPVVAEKPKEDPAPVVVLEIPRDQSLEMFILDPASRPILTATATIEGETRRVSDGEGRIHFDVAGSVVVAFAAPGYRSITRDLPPGSHRVHLESLIPPAAEPSPAPAPPVDTPAEDACGFRRAPTSDRIGCLAQVAAKSKAWPACQRGDEVSCHVYVREVARALAAGDPRWGLISKPRGQWSCSETECGANVGGYGEDIVAYLPAGAGKAEWLGADIVGGAGDPGARFQWPRGELSSADNRPDNLWVAVPR